MKKFLGFLKSIYLFPLNLILGVTTTSFTNSALAAQPAMSQNKNFILKSNLITIPAAGATNDILQSIPIKAGWKVVWADMLIVVAGVGTVSLSLGITGGTTNGFLSGKDGTAVAGTYYPSPLAATYPAAGGYFATADTTLDVLLATITSMTTSTQFYVIAEIVDTNN